MKLEVKLEIEEENGVQNKPTDDLQNELMNEPSFDSYMNENRPFFSQQSVAELLTALYEQQDISRRPWPERPA